MKVKYVILKSKWGYDGWNLEIFPMAGKVELR